MPFDSEGIFTRIHNWDEDRQNDIDIMSDRMDEEDNNFADGLSKCMLRDGRATMTGDLKMGNFKIQGVANGSISTDAVNKKQLDDAIISINDSRIYQTSIAVSGSSVALSADKDIYEVKVSALPFTLKFDESNLNSAKYRTFEVRLIKTVEGEIEFADTIYWEYGVVPDLEATGNYYLVFRKEPGASYWLASLQGRWSA